jgi:surface antigen
MSAAVGGFGLPLTASEPSEVILSGKTELSATAASGYVPRLSAPAKTNKYYYSDNNVFYQYGYGMPNCTCYAWGRAYELTGQIPDLCVYSAYLWYDYNIEYQIYSYGSEPRLGAIACWVYSSGTAGHVAVVEKIEDGVITFSNSAYSGIEFYTSTAPVDDPSDGRETWIFQGYIYIGDYESDDAADKPSTVTSDGDLYRITSEDGVNLRTSADTNSDVITILEYGQDYTVTDTKLAGGYTWGRTVYDGEVGWFVIDYARLVYRADDSTTNPSQAVDPNTSPQSDNLSSDTAPTPARDALTGDLDADGQVTIMDATRIQLIIAHLYTPTKHMLTVGDYDGDSVFSIMDASRLRYDLAFDK